eukprot:m.273997 g.273997  ORF g.273997 m.273997 type:complete len:124 (-) comp109939_c0_seq1:375-746(-)
MMVSLNTLFLWVNSLAQTITGLFLLLAPSEMLPTQNSKLRDVGNGTLSIGLISTAVLFSKVEDRPRFVYGVLAQYHIIVVCLQMVANAVPGIPPSVIIGFHGTLACWFAWTWVSYQHPGGKQS